MRTNTPRAVRPLVVLLVAMLIGPLSLAAAAPGPHACAAAAGAIGDGDWTIVPIPSFSSGEPQARHHASHRSRPGVHFVTNGTAVQRTLDGGCTWQEVYALPVDPSASEPYSAATGRIVDIAMPSENQTADRVYLVVLDLARTGPIVVPNAPTAAHIVMSPQGGAPGTFAKVDQGLQPVAPGVGQGADAFCGPLSGCVFAIAPSNGDVLYLALSPDRNGPGTLQRSSDGGRTWTTVTAPVGNEPVNGIEQLVISPISLAEVWIDHGGLQVSPDGGGTWLRRPDGASSFRPVLDLAAHREGLRALVISATERATPAPIAGIGIQPPGTTDFASITPGSLGLGGESVRSLAHGSVPESLLLLTATGVRVYHVGRDAFVDVDPRGYSRTYGPFRDVQAVTGGGQGTAFAMLGTGVLAVYHGPNGTAFDVPPPPVEVPPLEAPPAPVVRPATITPSGARIEVDPDTTVDLDVTLNLPAPPRVVDVFFLMDTSVSMEKTIDGLSVGLGEVARRVAAAGVDAHFGLAEFQDSDSGARGRRYRRRVDIAPPSRELQRELASIVTQGGNEPHLTALDQMATGAGLINPRTGIGVASGQGATWRPDSIRLAVMLTNEPYGRDASPTTTDATDGNHPDPDGPSEATVMAHLNEDGVRVVGVRIALPQQEIGLGDTVSTATKKLEENRARAAIADATLEDLQRWARKTNALAPTGGIDCNADGTVDLADGEPLVCTVLEDDSAQVNELTSPLVRLILSLADLGAADLIASPAPGLSATVAPRGDFSSINLGADQQLGFALTVGCSAEQAGQVLRLDLRGTVDGEVVATAPLSVACGVPPGVEAPVVEPAPPNVVPPPAPPAPPPAPVNAPVPAPVTAPAAVSVGAPAAAPAVAPAPGVLEGGPAEVQVRLANDRQRRGRLMMATARPEPAVSPIVLTLLGAVALTGVAGTVAVRDRKRGAQRHLARVRGGPGGAGYSRGRPRSGR